MKSKYRVTKVYPSATVEEWDGDYLIVTKSVSRSGDVRDVAIGWGSSPEDAWSDAMHTLRRPDREETKDAR